MDKSCPLGVRPAGHACQDGHHARTDVGTHCQVDALVERKQARHNHRDGDGRKHRRALDDGGEQRPQEDDQQRVFDAGEELFHRIESGEIVHGIRHHAEADKQCAEARQDAAHMFPRLTFREHQDKGADARKSRKQHGG